MVSQVSVNERKSYKLSFESKAGFLSFLGFFIFISYDYFLNVCISNSSLELDYFEGKCNNVYEVHRQLKLLRFFNKISLHVISFS